MYLAIRSKLSLNKTRHFVGRRQNWTQPSFIEGQDHEMSQQACKDQMATNPVIHSALDPTGNEQDRHYVLSVNSGKRINRYA